MAEAAGRVRRRCSERRVRLSDRGGQMILLHSATISFASVAETSVFIDKTCSSPTCSTRVGGCAVLPARVRFGKSLNLSMLQRSRSPSGR